MGTPCLNPNPSPDHTPYALPYSPIRTPLPVSLSGAYVSSVRLSWRLRCVAPDAWPMRSAGLCRGGEGRARATARPAIPLCAAVRRAGSVGGKWMRKGLRDAACVGRWCAHDGE